jgi:hypothetical protein
MEVYNEPIDGPLRMCGGRIIRGHRSGVVERVAILNATRVGICGKCYSLALIRHFAKTL